MIVVRVIGGLGNQMFQYAAAKFFETQFNTTVVFDISGFCKYNLRSYCLGRFNVDINYADKAQIPYSLRVENSYLRKAFRIYEKIFSRRYTVILENSYDGFVYNNQKDYYFDGYWQFEDFFSCNKDKLLEDFSVKSELDPVNSKYLNIIRNSNSVSIHIRRGDYISEQKNLDRFSICSLSYYEKAISYFENKIENPVFFVFSDDIDWARENLNIENVQFIDFNKDEEEKDLLLMSSCSHNIIANSTFSWWAAWLNKNENKVVISPEKWFNDDHRIFIPANWLHF